jgi:transposase-like protein
MHKNARLTPKGRALMLARIEAGQHQGDVAQAMGVSLTTLKKWLRRYRAEGAMGLLDRAVPAPLQPTASLEGTHCAGNRAATPTPYRTLYLPALEALGSQRVAYPQTSSTVALARSRATCPGATL